MTVSDFVVKMVRDFLEIIFIYKYFVISVRDNQLMLT